MGVCWSSHTEEFTIERWFTSGWMKILTESRLIFQVLWEFGRWWKHGFSFCHGWHGFSLILYTFRVNPWLFFYFDHTTS